MMGLTTTTMERNVLPSSCWRLSVSTRYRASDVMEAYSTATCAHVCGRVGERCVGAARRQAPRTNGNVGVRTRAGRVDTGIPAILIVAGTVTRGVATSNACN